MRLVQKLKRNHSSVVQKLESKGVRFNEVNRSSFEKRSREVFDSIPNVKKDTYGKIIHELTKIRKGAINE